MQLFIESFGEKLQTESTSILHLSFPTSLLLPLFSMSSYGFQIVSDAILSQGEILPLLFLVG